MIAASKMDNAFTPQQIITFYEKNSMNLHPVDIEEFKKNSKLLTKHINLVKLKSNNHFPCCVWSSNEITDGPDRCSCSWFEECQENLSNRIKWYKTFKDAKFVFPIEIDD